MPCQFKLVYSSTGVKLVLMGTNRTALDMSKHGQRITGNFFSIENIASLCDDVCAFKL